MTNFDTLVLSGNSTNAIYSLGALQKLFENNQLNNINTIVGTSSGSLIGALIAIGYEPIDVLIEVCFNKSFSNVGQINLLGFGSGILNFDLIENEFSKIILAKIGNIPTLLDIYEKFNLRYFQYNR
jgi:predicted acylesterase/phospholipase RssA